MNISETAIGNPYAGLTKAQMAELASQRHPYTSTFKLSVNEVRAGFKNLKDGVPNTGKGIAETITGAVQLVDGIALFWGGVAISLFAIPASVIAGAARNDKNALGAYREYKEKFIKNPRWARIYAYAITALSVVPPIVERHLK